MKNVDIHIGDWTTCQHDAESIRRAVFVVEQNIPEQEEWDKFDAIATHFLVYQQKVAVGTARLLDNHSVGRVAILKEYRGLGIGRILMQFIIEHAKQQKLEFLTLSAQVHAIDFYQSLGFQLQGDEYLDCGIPHMSMKMDLAT